MNNKNLEIKKPIKQFNEYYIKLLELIDEIEEFPPISELEKDLYIARIKVNIDDCLIQLNNIKNSQISNLENKGE